MTIHPKHHPRRSWTGSAPSAPTKTPLSSTDDRRLDLRRTPRRGPQRRRRDDRPGVKRGGPRRDLVAEHLALGRRVPGHPLRRRRVVPLNTRYTAGEAADVLTRTAAPLLFASGEFLGADKTADLDRGALPDLRQSSGSPSKRGM